jgi:hypothetical protein
MRPDGVSVYMDTCVYAFIYVYEYILLNTCINIIVYMYIHIRICICISYDKPMIISQPVTIKRPTRSKSRKQCKCSILHLHCLRDFEWVGRFIVTGWSYRADSWWWDAQHPVCLCICILVYMHMFMYVYEFILLSTYKYHCIYIHTYTYLYMYIIWQAYDYISPVTMKRPTHSKSRKQCKWSRSYRADSWWWDAQHPLPLILSIYNLISWLIYTLYQLLYI